MYTGKLVTEKMGKRNLGGGLEQTSDTTGVGKEFCRPFPALRRPVIDQKGCGGGGVVGVVQWLPRLVGMIGRAGRWGGRRMAIDGACTGA